MYIFLKKRHSGWIFVDWLITVDYPSVVNSRAKLWSCCTNRKCGRGNQSLWVLYSVMWVSNLTNSMHCINLLFNAEVWHYLWATFCISPCDNDELVLHSIFDCKEKYHESYWPCLFLATFISIRNELECQHLDVIIDLVRSAITLNKKKLILKIFLKPEFPRCLIRFSS